MTLTEYWRDEKMPATASKAVELELARLGLAKPTGSNRWPDYRSHYESVIMSLLPPQTQKAYRESFDWFERLCKPSTLDDLNKVILDTFKAELAKQSGRARGSKMSPATVNKHLRQVKILIQSAVDDELIMRMPKVSLMREPEKLPVDMLPEHFDAIYAACDVAIYPKRITANKRRQCEPVEWWRALMTLGIMTGMRISEMMELRWVNCDLKTGSITIDADENKGRREARIPLHDVVVLHLGTLFQFDSEKVFDWQIRSTNPKRHNLLYRQWHLIQQAASIDICRDRHEHEDLSPCHYYGFHSLKMACGT
jgi:integrase